MPGGVQGPVTAPKHASARLTSLKSFPIYGKQGRVALRNMVSHAPGLEVLQVNKMVHARVMYEKDQGGYKLKKSFLPAVVVPAGSHQLRQQERRPGGQQSSRVRF